MTNLEMKFADFQQQIMSQHDVLINTLTLTNSKLDALLAALGAPVPEGTVTLADVLLKLEAMRLEMVSQHAILNLTASNQSTLISYSGNTNSLVNTILSFLQAIDFCCNEAEPPTLPPGTSLTDIVPNQLHCQRIQVFLRVIFRVTQQIAQYSQSGNVIAWNYVKAAFDAQAEMGVCVAPATTDLINIAIAADEAKRASQYYYDSYIDIIYADALTALYAATNATEGKQAFIGVVNEHYPSHKGGEVLKLVATNGLFNCLYDQSRVWNLAGTEADLCAPAVEEPCHEYAATQSTVTAPNYSHTRYLVVWPESFNPVQTSDIGGTTYNWGSNAVAPGEWQYWQFRLVGGSFARIIWKQHDNVLNTHDLTSQQATYTLLNGTVWLVIDNWQTNSAVGQGFTVELCEPTVG